MKPPAYPAVTPGQPKAALTPAQRAGATKRARAEAAKALERDQAVRLAQIVNLHIAGMSLAQIGEAVGASADEVDRLLQRDAARYVRSQPALRVYIRNWVSERYAKMLEADWVDATDQDSPQKLETQDRAMRILNNMAKLHGAEAPTQAEVTVGAAPEAVENLVAALAAQQGYGYDTAVFDTVEGEVVHEAAVQSQAATLTAGEVVAEDDERDEDWERDDE